MATTGTTIINDVLSRIRDTTATLSSTIQPPTSASGRAFVLALLNHCQVFVSAGERLNVGTSDFVLSSDTPVYDLIQNAPSDFGGRILGVSVAGVGEIDGPVDYKALGRASRTWLTDVNTVLTQPLSWSMVGNTLVVLYPILAAPLTIATLRYAQAPPFLSDETKDVAIPDYATGHLARLTALVASIKTRQLTDFATRLQLLASNMLGVDAAHATGGKAD